MFKFDTVNVTSDPASSASIKYRSDEVRTNAPPSKTVPERSPERIGTSFVPVIVTTTSWVAKAPLSSVTVTVKVSVKGSPAFRA